MLFGGELVTDIQGGGVMQKREFPDFRFPEIGISMVATHEGSTVELTYCFGNFSCEFWPCKVGLDHILIINV